ncbi:MAG: DMT family transporter [Bryobacteraceae bacterium]|nr:DMT family transporter [Bryobacteraceae bacterium]
MSEGSSSTPSNRRIYSLLCLMVSLWALNFVVARFALREIPTTVAASLRAISAGLILLPVWFWRVRAKAEPPLSRQDLPLLAMLSFLGVALNQLCFLLGIERTSTSHAAVLIGLTPLFVLVASAVWGLEKLTARRMVGMGVALSGVAVLQMTRASSGEATILGDLLIAGASLTFAIYTVMGKKLTARQGGLTIATFSYVIGGLLLSPAAIWHGIGFDFGSVSGVAWTSLAYMTLFPSALCYLIFHYALKHIPASRVSNVGYLQPLLATMLGIWLLGDTVSSELVAGGSLVVTGVFLSERG